MTGASSGIGAAIALELAAAGCDVIVHCNKSVKKAERVQQSIEKSGAKAHVITADLGEKAGRSKLAAEAFDISPNLSIWVNNAGVDLLTGEQSELDYSQKLQRLLEVDVTATMELSRSVAQRWSNSSASSPCILNIGWDQAERGMGGDSGELFAAAKNAIMGFTRSLAVSVAPEIRVNCIAPGWIRTAWGETAGEIWQQRVLEETPLKRWGTPEDIAKMVRFLVSNEASYITGQILNVNGGAVR